MNIGIDANALAKQKAGIGSYLSHALLYLKQNAPKEWKFFLFSNVKISLDFPLDDNFYCVEYRAKIGTIGVLYKLKSLINEYSIDVFWGPSFSVPHNGQCKKIVTVHDLVPFAVPKTCQLKTKLLIRPFLKKTCNISDTIICDSDNTKNELTNYLKINPNKCVVCFPDYYKPFQKKFFKQFNFNLPGNYCLFIGSVEPRKNIKTLIKAFERIEGDLFLVIAGGKGWKSKKIFEVLNKSSKKDKIIYLGYVTEDEKSYLIEKAHFLVFPSIYEGFGLPVLEAYSHKKMIIVGRNSSLIEAAGPEGSFVENVTDADELADKIQWLNNLSFEDYIKQTNKNSLYAEKKFTSNNSYECILNIFMKYFNDKKEQ